MNEKVMVADTLAGINGELTRYGEMIPQTENPQLRLLCACGAGYKGRGGSREKCSRAWLKKGTVVM